MKYDNLIIKTNSDYISPLIDNTKELICAELNQWFCFTECEVGFISDKDEPCQSCPTGFYGRKCGDVCKCNEYEM